MYRFIPTHHPFHTWKMTTGVRKTGEALLETKNVDSILLQAAGQQTLPVTLLRVQPLTDNALNSTQLRPVFTSEVIPKRGVNSDLNSRALHSHLHGNSIDVLDSKHPYEGTQAATSRQRFLTSGNTTTISSALIA